MQELLARAISRLTGVENPTVTVPDLAEHGHFATPVALQLAKERRANPMGIAAELSVSLVGDPELEGVVLNAEVAAPGFVNIRLTPQAHHRALQEIIDRGQQVFQSRLGEKAIVEYSSVNVAKPIHVGHLRNTVLGASIARLLEATGTEVTRWNYLGDWGTQFGKVVVAYQRWGSEDKLRADPLAELVSLYVRFHEEAKEDASLEDEARAMFLRLEQGDAEVRTLWQRFRDASVDAALPLYEQLGARFDIWDGEASLEGDLEGIIDELNAKGLLEESEGARVVKLEDDKLPVALIQKTDGASLYLTRDLALLKRRLTRYPDHRILYVVANEQALNFQQLFAIAKRLGWPVERAVHVKYGLVLSGDGKKLSTREGRVVTAQEVLDEAASRVADIVKERGDDIPAESVTAIATGAVSYALLKDQRTSDIPFSWERLLDFGGDSGPYLQYTYARLASLIEKSGNVSAFTLDPLDDPRELELIRTLDQYTATVSRAAADLQTSHVALYLYQLASKVNGYYQAVPILKDEHAARQAARVALLKSAQQTLASGMQLLGISPVERV
jgi:arginyl-tRNA synthetase